MVVEILRWEIQVPVPKELSDLVARYTVNRDEFRKPTFNETQARIELIDPLFELIGWDMANRKGYRWNGQEISSTLSCRRSSLRIRFVSH